MEIHASIPAPYLNGVAGDRFNPLRAGSNLIPVLRGMAYVEAAHMLKDILADVVSVPDVLLIVRANGAVSEIRGNSLGVRQNDKWITIGDSDGPCHMHVNADLVRRAKFIEEERPGRTSFSVRFLDGSGERVLAAFFTRMYGTDGGLDPERMALYDGIRQKYGAEVEFLSQ